MGTQKGRVEGSVVLLVVEMVMMLLGAFLLVAYQVPAYNHDQVVGQPVFLASWN